VFVLQLDVVMGLSPVVAQKQHRDLSSLGIFVQRKTAAT